MQQVWSVAPDQWSLRLSPAGIVEQAERPAAELVVTFDDDVFPVSVPAHDEPDKRRGQQRPGGDSLA
jgi:hypothetical protein